MLNTVKGSLVQLDGEPFYKIENFDLMQDFFMTLTSSSDVWNFLWAQGGITAGRKNSDNSIFPYSTCDKISDDKAGTGSVTLVKIMKDGKRGKIWQPFESLYCQGAMRYTENINLRRNIYKNQNGSKVWFEEVNAMEGLAFRYGWTSSEKYGLIKTVHIENLSTKNIKLQILDGAHNIMCAQSPSAMQTTKSVLLDAYKKCEKDEDANMALFTLSSVVTDKAEPSECLRTNVSWFTTNDPVIISDTAVRDFVQGSEVAGKSSLLGKRGECYIVHNTSLGPHKAECWEQVFDVNLDAVALASLRKDIRDRQHAWKKVCEDIEKTDEKLTLFISQADGIQHSADKNKNLHHRTNVMFNIMRGGFFADEGKISTDDFLTFAQGRNRKLFSELEEKLPRGKKYDYAEFEKKIIKEKNPQYTRLFLEYMPLTFSRRHGDPSRPWNQFNIELYDKNGNPSLNFEGNWRDIFQNWEALLWSYPFMAKNMCAVFLDAMTVEGFNPYRISRAGIDWEIPEKDNPWSQYGYWTDHQVMYLQKLLEFFYDYKKKDLISLFEEKIFSSSDIPYKIKDYAEVLKNPRSSIIFEEEKDKKIKKEEKDYGMDRRLVLDSSGNVKLSFLSTKLLQIVLAKALNHIPGAGIWMNVQRPEWNDANNALAGYGASVVTMCHLYRMLEFLIKLYAEIPHEVQTDKTVYDCLVKTAWLYESKCSRGIEDSCARKKFLDEAGLIFEEERKVLYSHKELPDVSANAKDISRLLEKICEGIKASILHNRRSDGLFHSYNTVVFSEDKIEVQNLKLMLEGQVAVLSAFLLDEKETLSLAKALKESALYEKKQMSYMLYPNEKLLPFEEKNRISMDELKGLERLLNTEQRILAVDCEGLWHFAASIRNDSCLSEAIRKESGECAPTEKEETLLHDLYERVFSHQSFTGRSGCFYAYEGLGCIYWHQVSKLLLAVQENMKRYPSLSSFYDEVKAGLSYNKSPEEFGAFPIDPYSHTPYLGGAKQPGMTGQVKEEVLTRWGELGVCIEKSCCVFRTEWVKSDEFSRKGEISFTWCGTEIVYSKKAENGILVEYKDGTSLTCEGKVLPEKVSRQLFLRSGKINRVVVKA